MGNGSSSADEPLSKPVRDAIDKFNMSVNASGQEMIKLIRKLDRDNAALNEKVIRYEQGTYWMKLETQNASLRNKNAELETQNAALGNKNAELETQNAALGNKNSELVKRIRELEKISDRLSAIEQHPRYATTTTTAAAAAAAAAATATPMMKTSSSGFWHLAATDNKHDSHSGNSHGSHSSSPAFSDSSHFHSSNSGGQQQQYDQGNRSSTTAVSVNYPSQYQQHQHAGTSAYPSNSSHGVRNSSSSSSFSIPNCSTPAPAPTPPPPPPPKVKRAFRIVVVSGFDSSNAGGAVRHSILNEHLQLQNSRAAASNKEYSFDVDLKESAIPENIAEYDAACVVTENDTRAHSAAFVKTAIERVGTKPILCIVVQRGGADITVLPTDTVFDATVPYGGPSSGWATSMRNWLTKLTSAV